MRRLQRGFTLIEVMVVLSLLALVAVLGYSVFGSVYASAKLTSQAVQVHKELHTLSGAFQEYYRQNRAPMPTAQTDVQDLAALVSGGYLRTEPKPQAGVLTITTNYQAIVDTSSNFDMAGGPRGDLFMQGAYVVSTALCTRYNELFAPEIGAAIPTWTIVGANARMGGRHQTLCVRNATDATKHYIRTVAVQDLGNTF